MINETERNQNSTEKRLLFELFKYSQYEDLLQSHRAHNWMPAPVSTLALLLTSATSLKSIQPVWEFVANLVQDMLFQWNFCHYRCDFSIAPLLHSAQLRSSCPFATKHGTLQPICCLIDGFDPLRFLLEIPRQCGETCNRVGQGRFIQSGIGLPWLGSTALAKPTYFAKPAQ